MAESLPTVASSKNLKGLNIGHTNVYWLYNKCHEVQRLLNQAPGLHILGISEIRLLKRNSSKSLQIPNYRFWRKDGKGHLRTGMGVYIHNSVHQLVKRRKDLESNEMETMWLEFRRTKLSPALLIGFVYRNPDEPCSWVTKFEDMMDAATKNQTDVALLGDFNIDVLHSTPPSWQLTLDLFGLKQLVTQPTRIAETTKTLIDHIYTNNATKVSHVEVSKIIFSDHNPILCTWSCKIPKPQKGHTTV